MCSFSPCFIASVRVDHWKSGPGFFTVSMSFFLLRFWQWDHPWPHGVRVFQDIHTHRRQLRMPGWQHPCPGADGSLCGCSHAWLWSPREDQCLLGSHQCSSGKHTSGSLGGLQVSFSLLVVPVASIKHKAPKYLETASVKVAEIITSLGDCW